MTDLHKNKRLILFDEVCNFCNKTILKIINFDKKNEFVFASLQSDIGRAVIKYLQIDTAKTDSIILYEPTVSYDIKSSAALKVMNSFGGLWKLTQFFWLFPTSIRDLLYDFIAKNRYKWFGKREACILPNAELKAKFLE